jgi:hypothetical protein
VSRDSFFDSLKFLPDKNLEGPLGQLAFKEEAAGKVRVFAMVDV